MGLTVAGGAGLGAMGDVVVSVPALDLRMRIHWPTLLVRAESFAVPKMSRIAAMVISACYPVRLES